MTSAGPTTWRNERPVSQVAPTTAGIAPKRIPAPAIAIRTFAAVPLIVRILWLPNTGDKLRSSIMLGFVCFIPLFDDVVPTCDLARELVNVARVAHQDQVSDLPEDNHRLAPFAHQL